VLGSSWEPKKKKIGILHIKVHEVTTQKPIIQISMAVKARKHLTGNAFSYASGELQSYTSLDVRYLLALRDEL
jgi:hypothetical protein